MTSKRLSKKILKTIAFVVGGIMVLLVAFHFWFVNHAEEMIENLVASQSNGKVKLKVKKFKFNWFSRRMELQQAVFYSTDTVNSPISYRFEIARLKVQVQAVFPVIFEKKILIDSLHLFSPNISVTRLRASRDSLSPADSSLSIPQEMGRIYHSIQDALQVLKVDRFQIDDGRFSLINKGSPGEPPVRITNLYFHLENLRVDSSRVDSKQKILFSDNVALQTTKQDILFPDGRHRLSFSNFRINLRNRLAEFDSCTITATKGDSARTSFRIFFDKLRMTNIDFDTLYHSEVIKADSVYCINPRFSLDVELARKSGAEKPPQLNELIQQLTGDMQVAFVVVQNGSFDIKTVREGRPSSFTSDHNNFELEGLQIRKNVARPLTVERFAMAIRNYENFLRDSTYAIQFDSILIKNNRISLSNFSYQELRDGKTINSLRMPQFELYGLSWDNLIFDRQLKAERVSLYQPVINYDFSQLNKPGTRNVFDILSNIGHLLQLSNLNIIDGQLNLLFRNKARLQLENTTLFLLGEQLVASQQIKGIRRSVDILNFKRGLFTMAGLRAELTNTQFSGVDNRMKAERVRVESNDRLAMDARAVVINSMLLDDDLRQIIINGASWEQADIKVTGPIGKGKEAGLIIALNDIKGTRTKINASDTQRSVSVLLTNLSVGHFSSEKGRLNLEGFSSQGSELLASDGRRDLRVRHLSLNDLAPSQLDDIYYSSRGSGDTSAVFIPHTSWQPDINALLAGKFHTKELIISKPVIQLSHRSMESKDGFTADLPDIQIDRLIFQEPQIAIRTRNEKGMTSIEWSGGENKNEITARDIHSDPVKRSVLVGELQFSLDHFRFTNPKGRSFDAGKGRVNASLSKLALQRNETGGWDWRGTVSEMRARDFIIDSLGKNSGQLLINSARLRDLSFNSSWLLNPRELVKNNTGFRLEEVTGSYHNTKDHLNWFNAAYDKPTRSFSVDSFDYQPNLGKEDYIKSQPYQSDYVNIRTGRIEVGPFDIERYLKDTVLDLGSVSINKGYLTDFRDKRVPRKPGMVTLLPADMVKKIPVRLLIDTLHVNNTLIEYEEMNEKNNQSGKIAVARLNGKVTRLRNFNLSPTDSLEVNASGYLEDKIYTQLHVKESYTDSLGGFLMTGRMGAADLRVLNPVLKSLVSVELQSGQIDTMLMSIVGREYIAFGEMRLFYHDLKVRVIRPGERKKTLLGGVITFLANTIIKNKNDDKTTKVIFKRLRDRSAINYLVKIALSGFGSSIGVKKNKRLLAAYRQEIEAHPLPPMEEPLK